MNRYIFKHKKLFPVLLFSIFVVCGVNIYYYSALVHSEKPLPVVIRTWWPRFSWTWIIRNFSALSKENGYNMNSLQFSTQGYPNLKWYLSFYPYGDTEDTKHFVGLFLHFASDSEDVVYARCSLSISDSSGRVLNALPFDRGFSKKSHRYGYARFLPTRSLLTAINDSIVEVHVDLSIKTNGSEKDYKAEQDQCFFRSAFMQDFSAFQNQKALSDITIISNNERKFYCHRAILAARSSVFRKKILETSKDLDSVDLDFDSKTVRLLIDAIYGVEIRFSWLSATDTMNLLKAAQQYNLKDLKESCTVYLDRVMDLTNVVHILLVADDCKANVLKSSAMDFIHKNFRRFMGEYFKHLSINSINKKRLNELLREITEHDSL